MLQERVVNLVRVLVLLRWGRRRTGSAMRPTLRVWLWRMGSGLVVVSYYSMPPLTRSQLP